MHRKSDDSIRRSAIHRAAARSPSRSKADLARLDRAMRANVDTSDIGERLPAANRVVRDEFGRLPRKAASPIRDAILSELDRRQMTRQRLWKLAKKNCPTLPEATVYEFLRGQRQIGLSHVDALLLALGLAVAPVA